MTDAGLGAETLKFVNKGWGNRAPDSLDRRLRDLIALVNTPHRNGLDLEDDDPIAVEFARLGETTLEGQLRRLRNDLSHGNRNFTERELRPWLRVLESISRAHALRLLELPQSPGPEAAQPHSPAQQGPAGEGLLPSGG